MMPATAMRVAEPMTTQMTTKMAAASVAATTMPTSVPTAMATATMAAAALAQSRAHQHAGKRHHGNSNDRSQHHILPQGRAIEASELDENGTGLLAESSATAVQQARATPPARSCRG